MGTEADIADWKALDNFPPGEELAIRIARSCWHNNHTWAGSRRIWSYVLDYDIGYQLLERQLYFPTQAAGTWRLVPIIVRWA
jgi:hypothetical protein